MNDDDRVKKKRGVVVPIRPGVEPPKGEVTIIPRMEIDHEPTKDDPIEYWADWVGISWQMAVEYILETCEKAIKYRAHFEHGEWTEASKVLQHRLKLTQRSINMLIKIGECKAITNWKHASNLPASWTTLYELARLEEEQPGVLAQKLEAGEITPDTERKDVEKMIKARKGSSKKKEKEPANPWLVCGAGIDTLCSALNVSALSDPKFGDLEHEAALVGIDNYIDILKQLKVNLENYRNTKRAKIEDPVKVVAKKRRPRKKPTPTKDDDSEQVKGKT